MGHLIPSRNPSSTFAAAATTKHSGTSSAVGVIHAVSSFWTKWTRAAKKMAPNSPKSPLSKPKQLLLTLSSKGMKSKNKKKAVADHFDGDHDEVEIDFGDGGLWQRNILMGDKCQPLDFSGVIYYDSNGRQISECPMKSPRASPLPSYLYASSGK